jgi:hypothetical protein
MHHGYKLRDTDEKQEFCFSQSAMDSFFKNLLSTPVAMPGAMPGEKLTQ